MKKSEKKAIAKNILNGALSFIKSATVANPVINMGIGAVDGVVKGIQKTTKSNIDSNSGGVGNVDVPGAVGAIVGGIIIVGGAVALAIGWLTVDELKDIFKLWEKTQ